MSKEYKGNSWKNCSQSCKWMNTFAGGAFPESRLHRPCDDQPIQSSNDQIGGRYALNANTTLLFCWENDYCIAAHFLAWTCSCLETIRETVFKVQAKVHTLGVAEFEFWQYPGQNHTCCPKVKDLQTILQIGQIKSNWFDYHKGRLRIRVTCRLAWPFMDNQLVQGCNSDWSPRYNTAYQFLQLFVQSVIELKSHNGRGGECCSLACNVTCNFEHQGSLCWFLSDCLWYQKPMRQPPNRVSNQSPKRDYIALSVRSFCVVTSMIEMSSCFWCEYKMNADRP